MVDTQEIKSASDSPGSPNKYLVTRTMSESEKTSIEHGLLYKNPSSNTHYSIEWPDPSQMTLLLIKKPGDPAIDEWAQKMIRYCLLYSQ